MSGDRDDRHLAQDPEHLRAIQERRRSGAHGSHDTRPNRRRTRGDDERAAIEDARDH
jgi:hypothetical protein